MKKTNLLLVLGVIILMLLNGCHLINIRSLKLEEPTAPKGIEGSIKENKENKENQKDKEINQDLPSLVSPSTVRIIFAGDTMMDSQMGRVMDEKGFDYPLTEFMPILNSTDLVVLNLETAVGTSRNLMEKTYAFQTHPKYFSLFEPIGDKLVFSLANNHGMDGPLSETMMELNKLNYKYIGVGENQAEAFRPYVSEMNGVSVAIFAASRVIPHSSWTAREGQAGMATVYSHEPLISNVREWKEKVDHVIVFLHWGEELVEVPNQHQLSLDEKLVEAGARLIVGGHPHVIQELKWREEGQLTAYSLGNFVFTTSRNSTANELIALEVHLSKEKIEFAKVWPGKIHFGLVKHLLEGEERQGVLRRLRRLSPTVNIDEEGQITPINNSIK